MTYGTYAGRAIGLGALLTVSLVATAGAQDTTRTDTTRARSERVIPIQKDRGAMPSDRLTRGEARGEVRLPATRERIDSLEAREARYTARIDSISAATAALATRTEATERTVAALRDSLNMVRGELTSVRGELTSLTTRTSAIADSVRRLDRRFYNFRHGSIFGNSGWYAGLGTGANVTVGTLNDIGYATGLNLTVPIGWNRPRRMLGFRAELSAQSFNGQLTVPFTNPNPDIYSAAAMLTGHFPLNERGTNNFYLMGGGGVYHFRDFGESSGLADHLSDGDGIILTSKSETKWGVTGGAGVEIHVLGAASIFLQSSLTNVFAERGNQPGMDTGSNLRWIPLVAGVMFR